jgi:ubiquinone/menaquinone biosynthesis C-methylase UbiE
MVHLVDNPIAMLNEINRLLKSDGLFFISDLKRSPLGILEKEIKSSLTVKEAQALIAGSNLLRGEFSSDLIWWYYQNMQEKVC